MAWPRLGFCFQKPLGLGFVGFSFLLFALGPGFEVEWGGGGLYKSAKRSITPSRQRTASSRASKNRVTTFRPW